MSDAFNKFRKEVAGAAKAEEAPVEEAAETSEVEETPTHPTSLAKKVLDKVAPKAEVVEDEDLDETRTDPEEGEDTLPKTEASEVSKIDALLAKIDALEKKIGGDEASESAPVELVNLRSLDEVEVDLPKLEPTDFVRDADELTGIMTDPKKFNAFVNNLVASVREHAVRDTVPVVQQSMTRRAAIQTEIDKFWSANTDLNTTEGRKEAQRAVSVLAADNPEKSLEWVFSEAAKRARKILGMTEKAKDLDSQTKDKKGPVTPVPKRGNRSRETPVKSVSPTRGSTERQAELVGNMLASLK